MNDGMIWCYFLDLGLTLAACRCEMSEQKRREQTKHGNIVKTTLSSQHRKDYTFQPLRPSGRLCGEIHPGDTSNTIEA